MGLEFLTLHRKAQEQQSGLPDDTPPKRHVALRLGLFALMFVLYLCLGSVVFGAIEDKAEKQSAAELTHFVRAFVQQNEKCLEKRELYLLIKKVVDASDRGLRIDKNLSRVTSNWGFGQSFFFAGTLLTTVGYGHVSPMTQFGKAFTIVYCLLGIPVFLVLMSALVERLKYPSDVLLDAMHGRLNHRYRPAQVQWLHLGAVLGLLLAGMFVLPALFFMSVERDWTFLDAFYYCFISLTTIGLGDYIPGDKVDQPNRALYKIFTTGYLIFGIICMMVFLSVLYDIPQLSLSKWFAYTPPDAGERARLTSKDGTASSYTRQIDEEVPTPTAEQRADGTDRY